MNFAFAGKSIKILENGKWSENGYLAKIVIDGVDEAFIGSSWPNPFKPSNPAIKLDKYAGAIKAGEYIYQFSNSAHNGGIGFNLRTHDGVFNGKIPTINANPNQNGEFFATNVDVHVGYSITWRGSLACITIHPKYATKFFRNFVENEQGILVLSRKFETIS